MPHLRPPTCRQFLTTSGNPSACGSSTAIAPVLLSASLPRRAASTPPAGRSPCPHGRHPDRDTIFEIGSVTKVFTGLLLADMVERRELALDDAIDKFLPPGIHAPTRKDRPITLLD
ncbi:MAG: beta-lactamase family protein, partial [Planctomycetes bacterium]|nr:beta-lactamase family protein [Planctomycetota bacterium]